MPCRTDDVGQGNYIREEQEKAANLEATLCGVLSALRDKPIGNLNDYTMLDIVNWAEAGVNKRWAEDWWVKHQAEDKARLAKEAAKRDAEAKRARALAKLSKEDRKALGL